METPRQIKGFFVHLVLFILSVFITTGIYVLLSPVFYRFSFFSEHELFCVFVLYIIVNVGLYILFDKLYPKDS